MKRLHMFGFLLTLGPQKCSLTQQQTRLSGGRNWGEVSVVSSRHLRRRFPFGEVRAGETRCVPSAGSSSSCGWSAPEPNPAGSGPDGRSEGGLKSGRGARSPRRRSLTSGFLKTETNTQYNQD